MEAASGGLYGFFLVLQRSKVYELSRTGFFFPNPQMGFQSNFIPKLSQISLSVSSSGKKVEKFDQKKNHGGCLWWPPWFFFWSHKGPRFMSCPELGFFSQTPDGVLTLSPNCHRFPYRYLILVKKQRNLTKRKTMEAASGGLHGFFFGPTKVQGS